MYSGPSVSSARRARPHSAFFRRDHERHMNLGRGRRERKWLRALRPREAPLEEGPQRRARLGATSFGRGLVARAVAVARMARVAGVSRAAFGERRLNTIS